MNISKDLAKTIIEVIDEEKNANLEEVAKELNYKSRSKNQYRKINITSAVALKSKEKTKIKKMFKNKKNDNYPINFNIDKNIIGGLKIEWKDFILDLSIQEKINQLRKNL